MPGTQNSNSTKIDGEKVAPTPAIRIRSTFSNCPTEGSSCLIPYKSYNFSSLANYCRTRKIGYCYVRCGSKRANTSRLPHIPTLQAEPGRENTTSARYGVGHITLTIKRETVFPSLIDWHGPFSDSSNMKKLRSVRTAGKPHTLSVHTRQWQIYIAVIDVANYVQEGAEFVQSKQLLPETHRRQITTHRWHQSHPNTP